MNLETLAAEAFRKCKNDSLFCLLSNIFIQMNHIEIYYLCTSFRTEEECCLDEGKDYCMQCKRLKHFNFIYSKILIEKTFYLVFLVDKLVDMVFLCKYHLIEGLKRKKCKLNHKSILNHLNISFEKYIIHYILY